MKKEAPAEPSSAADAATNNKLKLTNKSKREQYELLIQKPRKLLGFKKSDFLNLAVTRVDYRYPGSEEGGPPGSKEG